MLRALIPLMFLLSGPAQAKCVGQNLYDALPEDRRAALRAENDAAPFAQGNLWTAEKDGKVITLVGTYHLTDPRHEAEMARLEPVLDKARALFVEAGPEEEAALKARMARDPGLMVITEGPTLPEQLAPEEWKRIRAALEARGIPGFMAAKFQPWYVAMLLGVPACAMADMQRREGLDHRLITAAEARGLPVRALEPYDTLFSIFDLFKAQDQMDMLRSAVAMEDQGEDMGITMADLYFRGEARMIWTLSRALAQEMPGYTPERVEREFALMEEAMMTRRNEAWIPVIEAAAEQGPALIAFGALHLAGEQGVLNLLAGRGWNLRAGTP